VEITYVSVMVRIRERLTLSNSRSSGKQQIRQSVAKLFSHHNIDVNYVIYVKYRLWHMSILAVSDYRPHTLLITYAQVEKPMLNWKQRARVFSTGCPP